MKPVQRTLFNKLYQPHRIGNRRKKIKLVRRTYLKHTKMQDMRTNKKSGRYNILGRFAHLRMITIYNIKTNSNRRPGRSFMMKRLELK